MTFTADAWERVTPILEAIQTHPFVMGLGDGSLGRREFAEYLAQDAVYLADYARALSALAAMAPSADEVAFWSSAARDAILVERSLHASHVELDAVQPSASCRAYTSYLLTLTVTGGYRVAAAGVLPCFWIYADVGRRLLDAAGDLSAHPYGDWIGLYADKAFDDQVDRAKAIVDEAARHASPDELTAMHLAFETASRYEWMFWDAAWRLEVWPV